MPVRSAALVSVLASHCLIAGSASTIAMLKGPDGVAWLDELGLPHVRTDASGRISRHLAEPRTASTGSGSSRAGQRQKSASSHGEVGTPPRVS